MPGSVDLRNDDFDFKGDALGGTATANTTTNFDYKVEEDNIYLQGGEILAITGSAGDYIKFEVVDKDNIFGFGANTVLQNFVKKWFINPDSVQNVKLSYGGKIPKNVYIRVAYTNTNLLTNAKIYINLYLHKEHL